MPTNGSFPFHPPYETQLDVEMCGRPTSTFGVARFHKGVDLIDVARHANRLRQHPLIFDRELIGLI